MTVRNPPVNLSTRFRPWPILALATALVLPMPAWTARAAETAITAKRQTVYGTDNRRETFALTGFKAKAASATVALVDVGRLRQEGQSFVLTSPTLRDAQDLCPGERFASQPTAAFCSGALVGPKLVVTAGHCISAADRTLTRFVFGYRMEDADSPVTRIPASDVYRATAIVDRRLNATADYALVQLDRPVTGRVPLKIARGDLLVPGMPVFLLGHPNGLPRKFTDSASVTDSSSPTRFTTNLDSFGGNSGSPIFAYPSNLVVGVLVEGAADYVRRGDCNVANRLPRYPGFEVGTRSTVFAPKVP